MLLEILLGAIIVLLLILILLVYKKGNIPAAEMESAVSNAWLKLGLDEKVGTLTTYASDIRNDYRSLETMLRVPTERGTLGEIGLETMLADQLSPDMFGVRKRILDGKIPDAHIRSTAGVICIDSKFPLDNYRRTVESRDDKEQQALKRQFIRDVQGHLDKIAVDYVRPEKGTADFAFAYIHSEGVYWFLVNEAFELLRNYAKKGVQVVSPLTMSHKIELIKAGVHARKLSEDAQKVQHEIITLSRDFRDIDEKWRVFYQTHLRNLGNKADEIDAAYARMAENFNTINRLSDE